MRTSRQEYDDATYEKALEAKCDTLQLKMDGWWSRTEIIAGELKVYSRTARHLASFDRLLSQPITATIIGELMYGTNWSQKPQLQGKVYAFDLWHAHGEDLEAWKYKDRYALLKTILPYLPDTYLRVANFDIRDYDKLWRQFVLSGEYEGVVFRRKSDPVGGLLLRQKNTITDEYICIGILEGDGKHQGRLGAVVIADGTGHALYDSGGSPATVGGGFDDEERERIFANPQDYIGRKFEVEGKARFESGLLRHPNFVRWKDV